MSLSRRHFLVSSAFAAPILGRGEASALSLESAPALLSEHYANRCQGDAAWQQAVGDLAAGLKSVERCPLCGCPVQLVSGRVKHLPPS